MEVVLTTLAATLCMQLGFLLWKVSAKGQPRIGHASALAVVRAMLGDWRWVLGSILNVTGWVLFVRATAIGEISVVQPLMSSGDIVLVALAVLVLGERMTRREWIGVGVTVCGAVGLALGAQKAPASTWDGFALASMVVGAGLGVAGLVRAARDDARAELALAVGAGLSFGCGAALTEAWTSASTDGWLAAILHPALVAMLLANACGLVLLQAAFQRGRAAVVVPVQLAVGNAVAVGAGVALFAESLSAERLAAIAVILAGAFLMKHPAPGARSGGIATNPRQVSTALGVPLRGAPKPD
jgi:drug/metabolite transporter (DMT)-like permease